MNEILAARDGTHTLNRTTWPIIVIPGILASRIEKVGSNDKIWDPDDWGFTLGLATRGPDDLARLFDANVTPGVVILEPRKKGNRKSAWVSRGWGGPAWDFYGDGIQALQDEFISEGGVVYAFGYDWRQSNRVNGKKLIDFIQTKVQPHHRYKPIITSHSMGGLVTRSACCQGAASMIAAVIHTFMPTYGTPEAYTKYRLGETDFALSKIIGENHDEISIIGSGVAGLFQLLPNQIYASGDPWLTWDQRLEAVADPGPYSLQRPYAIYRESTGTLGLVNHKRLAANVVIIKNGEVATNTRQRLQRILDNLNEAEAVHTQVLGDYCHPYTWLLSGSGIETVNGAHLDFEQDTVYDVPLIPQAVVRRQMGDGDKTVAFFSAIVLAGKPGYQGNTTIRGVEHAKMFNDDSAILEMKKYIHLARRTVPINQQRV
jgi:triacylglycerol esterase/lipase EstA (alpha/beta hydrolase family)